MTKTQNASEWCHMKPYIGQGLRDGHMIMLANLELCKYNRRNTNEYKYACHPAKDGTCPSSFNRTLLSPVK